jgi:RNA polymerase sigma-70 factor (ECF subfamily)
MGEGLTEAEIIARLERALRRMPKLQREIFLAVRLDDASYIDIAGRTGMSVAQVERLFAEALCNFSRSLDHPPRRRRRWFR